MYIDFLFFYIFHFFFLLLSFFFFFFLFCREPIRIRLHAKTARILVNEKQEISVGRSGKEHELRSLTSGFLVSSSFRILSP